MKKKYIIAGSITLFISAAIFILWLFQPYCSFFDSIATSRHYLDASKDITLDFEGASVSVNEWGKDYVEVTYNSIFGEKKKPDITENGNTLTLASSLDCSGYKHVDIEVPKAIINIKAERIYAKNVTLKSIRADQTSLRYCTMPDGFHCEGIELELRESKLIGSSTIKSEVVKIRECDSEDVILSPAGQKNQINVYLRDLTGKSVLLDAKSCDSLSAVFRDAALNKLTVDYTGNNGAIIIRGGSIDEVENHSEIDIKYKKNAFL